MRHPNATCETRQHACQLTFEKVSKNVFTITSFHGHFALLRGIMSDILFRFGFQTPSGSRLGFVQAFSFSHKVIHISSPLFHPLARRHFSIHAPYTSRFLYRACSSYCFTHRAVCTCRAFCTNPACGDSSTGHPCLVMSGAGWHHVGRNTKNITFYNITKTYLETSQGLKSRLPAHNKGVNPPQPPSACGQTCYRE